MLRKVAPSKVIFRIWFTDCHPREVLASTYLPFCLTWHPKSPIRTGFWTRNDLHAPAFLRSVIAYPFSCGTHMSCLSSTSRRSFLPHCPTAGRSTPLSWSRGSARPSGAAALLWPPPPPTLKPELAGGQATAASRGRHPRPAVWRVGSSSPRPAGDRWGRAPGPLLPLAAGTLGRRRSGWVELPQADGRRVGSSSCEGRVRELPRR
jgi:hypothetical protein